MPDDRRDDRITGHTIRFSWSDGPTRGETHEHVFHEDGSVEYHKVGGEAGAATREKRYASARVTDDVSVVSYLAASGFTLTVVLEFRDRALVGFASNDKQWFPLKGTFEVVK
jgi:hypothetical protein